MNLVQKGDDNTAVTLVMLDGTILAMCEHGKMFTPCEICDYDEATYTGRTWMVHPKLWHGYDPALVAADE